MIVYYSVVLLSLSVILTAYVWGRGQVKRKEISDYQTATTSIINILIFMPLFGRVFGWW